MTQKSPYKNSDDNKRYQTYNYYLKKRFGKKIYRAAMDIGAGCPNRDGSKAYGGCIFCPDGRRPLGKFCGISDGELLKRFENGCRSVSAKSDGSFIAYFQSGSNTYGDIDAFRRVFETACGLQNVVGLCVATRADCIDERCADMLYELSQKTYLTVELGLQTVHDGTAELCGRAHSFEDFLKGFKLLSDRGINVGVHIINGLPNETHDMMLQTAKELAKLPLHLLKIHMLFVERGTALCELYEQKGFELITRDEYVQTVCDQLEILPEDLIIARLTGDADRQKLVEPQWSLKKLCVMNEIDKELARRDSWQGKFFEKA